MLDRHPGLLLLGTDEVHRIRVVQVFAALLHRAGPLVQACVGGPRLVVGALRGLLRHDLQHGHALGALTDGGAQAVGAGVAAADHDDVLVLRVDAVDRFLAVDAAGGVRQVLHREVDAVELAPGQVHVARHGGADRHHYRVIPRTQLVPGDVLADLHAGAEPRAFGLHLLHAAVDQPLVEFEVGDAIAHQAADRVVALVDHDGVPGAGQLLGAGESGRSGADDGHGHVGQAVRRHRLDVVQLPRLVDDRAFVVLDHRRRLVDAQHAGRFA